MPDQSNTLFVQSFSVQPFYSRRNRVEVSLSNDGKGDEIASSDEDEESLFSGQRILFEN